MSQHMQFNVNAVAFSPGQTSPSGQVDSKSPKVMSNSKTKAPRPPRSNNPTDNNNARHLPRTQRYHAPQGRKSSRKSEVHQELFEEALLGDSTARNKRGQVSISHLMEFSLPPRPIHNPLRPNKSQLSYGKGSGYHPMDKAEYIDMTCRFVVDPRPSYRDVLSDPDCLIDMDKVLRVLSRPSACPICLEDIPEAPRMLRCGHIMCYPCLLRFLASEPIVSSHFNGESGKSKNRKECPLCFDIIRLEAVKPVSLLPVGSNLDQTKPVDLTLMFRPRHSLLAVPRDTSGLNESVFMDLPAINSNVASYSHYAGATETYLLSESQAEIDGLQVSKSRNEVLYGDSGDWIDQAIASVQYHMNVVMEMELEESLLSSSSPQSPPVGSFQDMSLNSKDYVSQFDDSNGFFFYQTNLDSETKFFLSSLDVRILRTAYGSYADFPSHLTAKVDNIIYGSLVDPEMKKRLKYLGHLPFNTPVAFLECNWSDIISQEVLSRFSKELQARIKRRKEKLARENKEHSRITREQAHIQNEMLRDVGFGSFPEPSSRSYNPPLIDTSDISLPSPPASGRDTRSGTGPGTPETSSVKKTVWGTEVVSFGPDPPSEQVELTPDIEFKARRKGKKLVLMSTNGGW